MADMTAVRIGQGFDAHRFAEQGTCKPLWLACLRWADDERRGVEGIDGDSDGDVASHAVVDAVLSACGMGDIGSMFGVGADSMGAGMHGDRMLQLVRDRVTSDGWHVVNVSVSIVGNAPRVGKRRQEACEAMTRALGAPVTITATTTDGMGFTGRGEGIAAIATALVSR